jgi:endoglucanase
LSQQFLRRLLARRPLSVAVLALGWAAGCSTLFPSSDAPSSMAGGTTIHAIRLDSVGFLPDRAKRATVITPGGTSFEVHDANDNSTVWSGPLAGPNTDNLTGADLWLADFTPFTTPGTYYLQVPAAPGQSVPAQSSTFQIASDAFSDAVMRGMMGLHGARCGTAVKVTVNGETWSHAACHQNDAYLNYLTGENTIRPSVGGWHDAGDYGKYVTNGAFTVGMLLHAWQHFQPALMALSLPIPEHGGPIPDFLAEVKWELDWLLTTQGADGGVAHKVTALVFEGFVMPQDDLQNRFYTGVGTSATGDVVAVMAEAARVYAPFDPDAAARYLAAAQAGYAFLAANPNRIFPDLSKFKTGTYGDNDDTDERLWAAAELWETTGDPTALADVEARIGTAASVEENFDWGNVGNMGVFTYLLSKRDGRNPDTAATLQQHLLTTANNLAAVASNDGYGRSISNYWWGSNGAVARTAMNLWAANALSPDPKYLDGIVAGLDHVLGRNQYDRSQVTMVGHHPPMSPHHRLSAQDGILDPWPGLMVGGQDTAAMPDWVDNQNAYNVNEVAINWVGAFVYAGAATMPGASP